MATKGAKALYMVEQIKAELAAIQANRPPHVNPVKIPSIGQEYFMAMREIDAQRAMGRYVWDGLPDELTGWQLENMLYHRASLLGFFWAGKLYVLPYAQSQGINEYGLPIAGRAISYNGAGPDNTDPEHEFVDHDFYIISGSHTTEYIERKSDGSTISHPTEAAILCDRIPFFNPNQAQISQFVIGENILREQCDIMGRIDINIKNSNLKLVFTARDEMSRAALEKALAYVYGSELPFTVITQENYDNVSNQLFQTRIELETQGMFEAWQSYDAIRRTMLGLPNSGPFEKKERKITGELDSDSPTDVILDNGLQMRRLWLAQMKVVYAREPAYYDILNKISVRVNPAISPSGDTREGEQNGNKENDDNDDGEDY